METATPQRVYEGTWEEVVAHAPELAGRRVTLIVEETPAEIAIRDRLARLKKGLSLIEEVGRDQGPFPNYAMTTEFFYPDDEKRG